mgnify:CR=1 FL=1
MNDFKKDLQVKGLLTNNVIENLEKQNYKTKKLAMCKQFHRNSKIHKYLHNLVATIMIFIAKTSKIGSTSKCI